MIGEEEKERDSAHLENAQRDQSPRPRKISEYENPFRTDEDSSADGLSRAVTSDPDQTDSQASETKARHVVEASATVSHY